MSRVPIRPAAVAGPIAVVAMAAVVRAVGAVAPGAMLVAIPPDILRVRLLPPGAACAPTTT